MIIVEKVYILITCLCSYVFFLQWRFLHSLAHESPKKEFNCLIKQIKTTIIQRVPIHVHILIFEKSWILIFLFDSLRCDEKLCRWVQYMCLRTVLITFLYGRRKGQNTKNKNYFNSKDHKIAGLRLSFLFTTIFAYCSINNTFKKINTSDATLCTAHWRSIL